MTSWGTNLWDKHKEVVGHVTEGANKLLGVYAKYVKEKADIEREYAKGLRKLIARYEIKKQRKNTDNEETSETTCFRTILIETGYQAGQHELIAEYLANDLVKEIQEKSKEVHAKLKNNTKDVKRKKRKLNTSYFDLEKAKLKYQKSFQDWKESERNYERADEDGTIPRNEILKMKMYSETKLQEYEDYSSKYQEVLNKTNDEQIEYFDSHLLELMNTLQEIDRARVGSVIEIFKKLVKGEWEMVNIENKCRESIDESIAKISVEEDQNSVVERYKTGDLPPPDFQFEKMTGTRGKRSSSLTRMSKRSTTNTGEKHNHFQKKRSLLRTIETNKSAIAKGTKEVNALQLLIKTYKETPDFGDPSQLQEEVNILTQDINKLEKDLATHNRDLDLVESKMNMNIRHSLLTSHGRSLLSVGRTNSSSISSIYDISENHIADDPTNKRIHEDNTDSEITETEFDYTEVMKDNILEKDDSNADFPIYPLKKLIALYSYEGEEEGTLSMDLGDEFEVLCEDTGGWTQVRRAGFIEEGFIPTAFTQQL